MAAIGPTKKETIRGGGRVTRTGKKGGDRNGRISGAQRAADLADTSVKEYGNKGGEGSNGERGKGDEENKRPSGSSTLYPISQSI